ncbi:aminoglycoside phosphotransferase family protein [Bacillus tianshenii]|uniref:aminoglycoside phosphotransferase family protein n=1 Tax=Sutcliffiella tianshenii TaxID=1463404 RepID=UPI001CD69235|nr:aminoglycoside phosphotransferase family protein [Bacillus tianshenii]MCA1321642.1 aminoglycoside phosphotransferase family protein [Bacillus tianshenii]
MDSQLTEKITYLKNAKSIVELKKGFSFDKKYIIDNEYLLRLFPIEDVNKRRIEYDTIHALSAYSDYVPAGVEFNTLEELDKAYMILTYLPGEDAEVAMKGLTEKEQYYAGFDAGRELKKLHELKAQADYEPWHNLKKKKSDKYIEELKKIDIDESLKGLLESYILKNEHLMKERPNRFQHDDFHPSNLVIQNKAFAGIIDFQRMDWGDPIHDLQKLGFFSKRVSVPFTKGVVDGYHEDGVVTREFWELYSLYSAMHVVSAIVWGKKMGPEQYKVLYEYSMDVLRDHGNFSKIIPDWYKH